MTRLYLNILISLGTVVTDPSIVVLVYNPVLLPLFLVNFLVLGSAEPSLSKMLLYTLLSYRCYSLLLQGTPSSQAIHVRSSLPSQYYDC